jgi:hypothetical protein
LTKVSSQPRRTLSEAVRAKYRVNIAKARAERSLLARARPIEDLTASGRWRRLRLIAGLPRRKLDEPKDQLIPR